MNATHVSKDPQGCRSVTRRKLLSAGLIAGLVAALSGVPASAGNSTDPDITDVAGDANFVNGQGVQQGQQSPDTRPASFDNTDLRAVWFETAYSTTKIRDAGGNVQRVEYTPTALKVNIQTEGPVRPLAPWTYIDFKVPVTLPGCRASLEWAALASSDRVEIRPIGAACDPDHAFARSSAGVISQGNVSTYSYPFTNDEATGYFISPYLSDGTLIAQPSAYSLGRLPAGSQANAQTDEMAVGRSFTIGQDVPADIDCTSDPANTECQS